MSEILLFSGTLTSTVLYHVYNFFKEGRGANMSAYSPRIEWAHATEGEIYENQCS